MKVFKTTLAIFCATTLLISCGGGKKADDKTVTDETKKTTTVADNGAATKLEGSWEVKSEDGDPKSEQVGTVYEFKGNKLTTSKDGINIPGTTEVTDGTFSFLMDGGKDKVMYNYKFEGDGLVISMQDGPQVFHLVKK